MTLPSNSSADYFPDNTASTFKTQLPKQIDLEGEWEVGLSEIQYQHTWYNLRRGDYHFFVIDCTLPVNHGCSKHKIAVPGGFYRSPEHLKEKLNAYITRQADLDNLNLGVSFKYDDITRKFSVNIEGGWGLLMAESLCSLLGFSECKILPAGTSTADVVVDMTHGFYSIYIYLDILKPRIVGDCLVPLLRIVPVEGDEDDTITRTYENVHYVSVQRKSFRTVEVYIRDDTGAPVPFERGKSVLTLHFRRKRLI